MIENFTPSRRKFLKNVGYISVSFSLLSSCTGSADPILASRENYHGDLPRSMQHAGKVNAWLEILENGQVKVFSGKVELGQGIRTAIQQMAAEELDTDLDKVEVHLAETGVTPNEGYTAGSASIKNSAMSVRYAAATARRELLKLASEKLDTPTEKLIFYNGSIKSKKNKKSVTLQELLKGAQIETEVTAPVPIKNKGEHKYVGKAIHRADIRKMALAEHVFIQDLRFPGMVHARVVRPPNYKSKLLSIDVSQLSKNIPGIIKTVVNGDYFAVITKKESQAVKAERYLKEHSEWSIPKIFPEEDNLYDHLRKIADPPKNISNKGDVNREIESNDSFKASYTKPYLKHGSMGPACSVALFDKKVLHAWSHSQGIYPLREALATMLNMDKDNIHITSVPGAGCFGHSTADDASADAALLAMELPGKHVRVQWSRSDEHAWDPYGTAAIVDMQATLNKSGKITAWKSDIWSDSHSTRPNSDPATLLAARHVKNKAKMQSRGYLAGAHRNGEPYYTTANMQVNVLYFDGPLRVSSIRSLGSFANIFAIESFMDELAEKAGKDPVDFRLSHLDDKRAIATLQKVQEIIETQNLESDQGIGFAFTRYKNTDAYISVAVKLAVNTSTGMVVIHKMWAVIDVGEVINLDGIKNQTEGGMIQAASWTLKEQVTFSDTKINSTDWSSYPIFRFSDIPEVEVVVIDRPEMPAFGGGEAALPPVGAAISNAIYNACGKRIYDLPITPEKIIG